MLGGRLAFALGVQVGDTVTLLSPNGNATAFGTVPRVKTYRVAATFDVRHVSSSILAFIYMNLPAAQLFFKVRRMPRPCSTSWWPTPIRSDNGRDRSPRCSRPRIRLFDWQQSSAAFFNAVQTERNVMFLILTLIILVAAFNVISSLIMLVKDKGARYRHPAHHGGDAA